MKTLGFGLALSALVVAGAGVGCEDASSATPTADGGVTPDFGIDAGPVDAATAPATCPTPTGGPTKHQGDIPTETWTAAASPHMLPYDANISGTLTLEPCAEVLLAPGITISVRGALVANGTATQPIHIGAQDSTKPFVMIRTLGGSIHLAWVNVDGGGDPSNISPDLTGMLNLQGNDQTKPGEQTLFVDHVTLAGSKTNGLVLRDGAGFATGSTDLTVTGSTLYPVSTWSRAAGGLPTGKYTGNGHDEILLPGGGGNEGFAESSTLHDRGVPYHAGTAGTEGDLRVGPATAGGATSTLTIEPGVTIRVKKGGVFHVGFFSSDNPAAAALIAVGTPDKPITFTSAEAAPAAGDWLGLHFGDQPLPTNKLDYVHVEWAGGVSGSGSNSCPYPLVTRSDAAIRISGGPASQFITNTKISNSGFYGIDRGWRKDNLTDFLPTNTFEGMTHCLESYPKTAAGGCPDTVPCPL